MPEHAVDELRLVAEGIKRQQLLAILQDCHCDESQAYLFSKPLPEKEFEGMFIRSPTKSEPVTGTPRQ